MALTAKQRKFADYVAEGENHTKAAILAGYSEKNAASQASENLKKPKVLEYIHARMRANAASPEEVLAFQTNVMRGNVKDQFGLDATLDARLKASELIAKKYAAVEKNQRQAYTEREREAEIPFDIPGRLLAKEYVDIHRDVLNRGHRRYLLKGGRGSGKSTYISLEIINILENNPEIHAVVLRKIGNTLRNSVYNQILWAIGEMGLADRYTAKQTPLEIIKKSTGQKIRFFGLDDPLKLKSIKPEKGYNGILWAEEKDQFAGQEELRSAEQSVIRGGEMAYVFESFNPPKTRDNWANEDADIPQEGRLVLHTDYRTVPPEWLGENFLDLAEYQKEINPMAYEHEYLGIPNGNGGMVFENVVPEEIPDEMIRRFDRRLCGVDWGYFPDPWAFNIMHFDAARRVLYIFGELTAIKTSNRATADMIYAFGVTEDEIITADSAEPKSVADYRSYGLNCYGANKGPGSVDYSMKWLQSLTKIVIDPARCPDTYAEFVEYEYERTKDGKVMSGYPDRDNHHIDAVRYATEEIWKWMGE